MTNDGPPHELRGLLGQIIDPAAGAPTLVSPTPGPNAVVHARPGVTPQGASSSPHGALPLPFDPGALAIAISQLANEMFAGSSVVPVPGSPSHSTFAGGAPGSPGVSPQLAPSNASVPGTPTTPQTAAIGTTAPSQGAASDVPASGGALPMGAGLPFAGVLGSHPLDASPSSPAIAPNAAMSPYASTPFVASPFGASAAAPFDSSSLGQAPSASGLGAPFADSSGGAPSTSQTPAGSASPPWSTTLGSLVSAPEPTSTSSAFRSPTATSGGPYGASPAPTSPSTFPSGVGPRDRANGSTGAPASVAPAGVSTSPHGAPTASSPFGALAPGSLDALSSMGTGRAGNVPYGTPPDFGSIDLGSPAMLESMAIPLVAPVAVDASPSYLPGASSVLPASTRSNGELGREVGGAFDPYAVRRDFPILEERVHGDKRLVWLDNAATTQKPRAVIDRLTHYYEHENSNVHRAAHTLAARATDAFERGRESTRRFLNAGSSNEIVFVRGATEGINLVAKSWGRRYVTAGDEIVITHLEHHANIVPWQMLCAETGAKLRVAPVDDRGDVILEEYERLMSRRTRLVAFPHVSNALGTITPAREMVAIAHRYGARVLVDGAQAVSHMRVDVQELDCDWYVLSGHKVFAPTGIGAVFGKADVLEESPPWQGGGNMIQDVTFEKTTYQPPPGRFEAGTGSIADAAGLGAALDYIMKIGMDTIDRYEHELLVYGTSLLARVPGLRMIGTSAHKASVLSFVLDGQRTEDVGAMLDADGIAVRSGHHCAQPILRRFGLEASVRASLAFYNVHEDLDALYRSLLRIQSNRRSVS